MVELVYTLGLGSSSLLGIKGSSPFFGKNRNANNKTSL